MLIRTRRDHSFRSTGPVGLPRTNINASADSTFRDVFLRANSNASNGVPAPDPLSSCPDIWIAGQTAVPNYTTALATDASYNSSSPNNVTQGENNIIYVRGKNGATSTKTKTVTLYYAGSGVIQQPSKWQNNIIKTDLGDSNGSITNLAANAVGVCTSTFLWSNPQPPPPGSDHYCLFAQFNDANDSNPFPDPETVFEMTSLIRNNLGWGWRNVSLTPPRGYSWQLSEPLAIPSNYPKTENYQVIVTPTGGWVNWSVEFYCSRADSKGNPIALKKTKIEQDGQLLGVHNIYLEPGWEGQMTVNVYCPDGTQQKPQPGWSMPLSANYYGSGKKVRDEALHRGLIDFEFHRRMRRFCPDLMRGAVGPTIILPQGAYTGEISDTPHVNAWFDKQGHKY